MGTSENGASKISPDELGARQKAATQVSAGKARIQKLNIGRASPPEVAPGGISSVPTRREPHHNRRV